MLYVSVNMGENCTMKLQFLIALVAKVIRQFPSRNKNKLKNDITILE